MPCERKHIEAIGGLLQVHANSIWLCAGIEIAKACSAALAACDESQWRGMDSAPKDGSPFIVHVKGADSGGEFDYTDAAKFDGLAGKFVDIEGVEFVDECMAHWMPLPAAPEVKDD